MDSQQTTRNRKRILRATRVAVYASLAEKFGSNQETPSRDTDPDQKMNFQLDRLFTVIHDN